MTENLALSISKTFMVRLGRDKIKAAITTNRSSTHSVAGFVQLEVCGRVLKNQDIPNGINTINLSSLPTGFYHVGINKKRIKLIK